MVSITREVQTCAVISGLLCWSCSNFIPVAIAAAGVRISCMTEPVTWQDVIQLDTVINVVDLEQVTVAVYNYL